MRASNTLGYFSLCKPILLCCYGYCYTSGNFPFMYKLFYSLKFLVNILKSVNVPSKDSRHDLLRRLKWGSLNRVYSTLIIHLLMSKTAGASFAGGILHVRSGLWVRAGGSGASRLGPGPASPPASCVTGGGLRELSWPQSCRHPAGRQQCLTCRGVVGKNELRICKAPVLFSSPALPFLLPLHGCC